MRRTATYLAASLFLIGTVSGCSLFGKKKAETDPLYDDAYASTSYDQPTTDYESYRPAATTPQPQPQPTYDPYLASQSAPTTTTPAVSGTRYHTVVKKDTLYALARQYYGDQSRWKDIYEANRGTISDPNKIRVGQKLVIP